MPMKQLIRISYQMTKIWCVSLFVIFTCASGVLAQDVLVELPQQRAATTQGDNIYLQNIKKIIQFDKTEMLLGEAIQYIADQVDLKLSYSEELIPLDKKVTIEPGDMTVEQALWMILDGTTLRFGISSTGQLFFLEKQVTRAEEALQVTVSGMVTDAQTGEALPGVNILVKGTTDRGTSTNFEGFFELLAENPLDTLIFSYIGYQSQEILIDGRNEINVEMYLDLIAGEELVVVGYGTMRHQDLTGSVSRADIDAFRTQPNTSIMQSLQGTIPGLNVGQITQAGQEPNIEIRDRTTISGSQDPLIVVDGIIYRGNIIDLNPADVESVDILKDVSAAAIYGSQAANGVIMITTKTADIVDKPVISYSNKLTFQTPINKFSPTSGSATIGHLERELELSDLLNSRTPESGYLNKNPNWILTQVFRSPEENSAYNQGRFDNWYEVLTNDIVQTYDHNLSLATRTEASSLYMSLGYMDQGGYMMGEGFNRISARVNADNKVTEWFEIGFNSFISMTENDGPMVNTDHRYISPVNTARNEIEELYPIVAGNIINPLIAAQADYENTRMNLHGTIYTNIEIPFIEGLSYTGNFSNNYRTVSDYIFEAHAQNYQGRGSKREERRYEWSSDHVINYKNLLNDVHRVDITLLYGAESRDNNYTQAISSIFDNHSLGYHNLQSGSSGQQQAISGGWEESSLYQMARIFYGYDDKYQLTATIRRDGFSGFSEANKFGYFPSLALAWVATEESFVEENFEWLDHLKFKASYGSIGNRTIGRYQTLSSVQDGFGYVNHNGESLYYMRLNSLASPDLKWETTTGFNLGVEFGVLSRRLSGNIEYYSNKTVDLLYDVDIPDITRYSTFPDNLGRLDNHGIEVSLTTINIQQQNLWWESTFSYSRSRNELKELLGFDLDGDGREDDLISEGLFIGESIDAIYDYTIDGFWQVGDDIPAFSDLGAYRIVDINGDGQITPDDRSIIGYTRPSFRFSIINQVHYKNWSLNVFINAVHGGKDRYLAVNDFQNGGWGINSDNMFRNIFPANLDYWAPENPNATYVRPGLQVSDGLRGLRYAQRNFVRLQDISVAYNLPTELLNRIQVRNLRLFISGKNLVTMTSWQGWDPETGQAITRGGRPVMKGITMGVDISF